MTPTVSIRQALTDKQLLGGVLDGESWQAWKVLLIAAMGEALTDDERALFKVLTGREHEAGFRVEDLIAVVGRRGGKSRAISVLACWIAGLNKHERLVHGEKGVLLCIAPDQRQASIVLNYCTAAFEASPILKQLIANRTADTLELTSGISIEVRSASFRRLRGPSYVGIICDESAFWLNENSTNPDHEIIAACRPGLATTGGPLIMVSSPYARKGVLWEMHKAHYGASGDPAILVAQGESRLFNPSLPQSVVDRALERDRPAAEAEFLARFRRDLEAFVSYDVVQACVGEHVEMGALDRLHYHGFVDPSGGSIDPFTLAISHIEGDRVIVDAVREITAPHSPDIVVEEFAAVLKSYKITTAVGDRFAGEWPRDAFRKRGIAYECCAKPKSALYVDLLPLLNSGRILLPKNDRLIAQLVNLERTTARSGKDSIDHPRGQHDDIANACAGTAALSMDTLSYDTSYAWLTEDRDAVVEQQYRWPPLPRRLHPNQTSNLTDDQFKKIADPPRLL